MVHHVASSCGHQQAHVCRVQHLLAWHTTAAVARCSDDGVGPLEGAVPQIGHRLARVARALGGRSRDGRARAVKLWGGGVAPSVGRG